MADIHPTAIVSPKAQLGENVTVGPFSIIEEDVIIGAGTRIDSSVLIASGARIGKKCKIHKGAVLSSVPQDLKFNNEKTFLEIGDGTTVREFATLNRGTDHSIYTRVGKNCLIMAYVHIAHDCQIGNNVVIANAVNMAGHIIIEDNVGIGGMTAFHQFVHIGEHAFVGGMLRVNKDVPPYILANGAPVKFTGLNLIGMKRKGFDKKTLDALKNAYKIIYDENLLVKEAIERIENELESIPQIEHLLQFLKESERGIIRS
jgi:UDP-N-acetylglucosamine acyltransferase